MKSVILLASGGLDSTVVAYKLLNKGYKVKPIFFDYGQHCVETEWERLNDVLPKNKNIELPERNDISDLFRGSKSRLIVEANLWEENIEDEELYVPYRTLLFFVNAAVRAQTLGLTEVYAGYINTNYVNEIDCSTSFFNDMDDLTESIGSVRFKLPLRDLSKADVVKKAIRLKVPIGRTFSCQVFSELPCGACPNCVERLSALKENGLL